MEGEDTPRPIGRGRGRAVRNTKTAPRKTSPARIPGLAIFSSPSTRGQPPSSSSPESSSPPSTLLEALSIVDENTEPKSNVLDEGSIRRARRGARFEPDIRDSNTENDYVLSRPSDMINKQGNQGNVIPLMTNYIILKSSCPWALYEHSVKFEPTEDSTMKKKFLFRQYKEVLGVYIFDGSKVYTPNPIAEKEVVTFTAAMIFGTQYKVTIEFIRKLPPGESMYMQFYKFIRRKCLFGMGLEEIGRHFFDHRAAIEIPGQELVLWPGFVTAIRLHEQHMMLCVEITHKVIRLTSVLDVMKSIRDNYHGCSSPEEAVKKELLNCIVVTRYNRKTYKVLDITWDLNPMSTFDMDGKATTYVDYYKSKYNLEVRDPNQPLFVAKPSQKHKYRGDSFPFYILPEFCQLTGLTDEMRDNFRLMKDLSEYLHMKPHGRINSINRLMQRLQGVEELKNELAQWNVRFDQELAQCQGRILPRENIVFAITPRHSDPEKANDKADWTMAFRSRQMLKVVGLDGWVIIAPDRESSNVDNLVITMTRVAKPLNMMLSPPLEIVRLSAVNNASYLRAIDTAYRSHQEKLQMMFVILPNDKPELYGLVKRRLSIDIGIPSQCFVAKNLLNKGLMLIGTKVVIQMNAKLGGQPWSIELPLNNAMVVGFDVHRARFGSTEGIGAMVATTSSNYAAYYSTVSSHSNQWELSNNMCTDITKCLHTYQKINTFLPDRIIFFRDGVGDGQLHLVFNAEMVAVQLTLNTLYEKAGNPIPKFTFIVVTKRVNTRLFDITTRRPDNPPPGTVVDSCVTLPERYDFFLVSQTARQGTVSPCNYNVLMDTQGLGPDKVQRLAYKMCHMYFNWSGAVAVPAPCQYAHKLAFLCGTALDGKPNAQLSNLLHFL